MYVHLLASCAAYRERLEALEQVIEAEMVSFSDLVAEDDVAFGRKPFQHQEIEDEDDDEEIMIIEQPTVTIEVPDEEDETSEVPEEMEYVIADEVSLMEDTLDVVKMEDASATIKMEGDSATVKMAEFAMDMPSTSGQNVEVLEGFTIKTFEPEAVPESEGIEIECKPDINVKEEPTFSEIKEVPKSQLTPKILRPKINPLRPDRSRIDRLHENLRQKLKKATKPLTRLEYLEKSFN